MKDVLNCQHPSPTAHLPVSPRVLTSLLHPCMQTSVRLLTSIQICAGTIVGGTKQDWIALGVSSTDAGWFGYLQQMILMLTRSSPTHRTCWHISLRQGHLPSRHLLSGRLTRSPPQLGQVLESPATGASAFRADILGHP